MTTNFFRPAIVCILLAAAAVAQNPPNHAPPARQTSNAGANIPLTLHIGDPAPKLQQGRYLQGAPVSAFESGTVYVIGFWHADRGGETTMAIQELERVHLKYKDRGVVVIGQDVLEHGSKGPETAAAFVQKAGSNVTFRVALDTVTDGSPWDGKMAQTWLGAAGFVYPPCAFVVDQSGKIAWTDGSLNLLERAVKGVLEGNLEKTKAMEIAKLSEKARVARAETKHTRKEDAARQQTREDLERAMSKAFFDRDYSKALALADEAEKNGVPQSRYDGARFRIYLAQKDGAAAARTALRIADEAPNPDFLDRVAKRLLDTPGLEPRDPATAEKLCNKAITGQTQFIELRMPYYYHTLARAQFMNGKKTEAIASEKKAIELKGKELAAEFKPALDSYLKGELPRVDWNVNANSGKLFDW